jgi:hypothetical protein
MLDRREFERLVVCRRAFAHVTFHYMNALSSARVTNPDSMFSSVLIGSSQLKLATVPLWENLIQFE